MPQSSLVRGICLALAVACLVVAVARLSVVALVAVNPSALSVSLRCAESTGCKVTTEPLRLIPQSQRASYSGPEHERALREHFRATEPRLLLASAAALTGLPYVVLYAGLAVVFRFCARGQPFHSRAIRWVRRSAGAALLGVAATPLASGLRSLATLPAFGVEDTLQWTVDLGAFLGGLFLAGAVWTAAWAMSQARALEDETSLYV